MPDQKKKVYKDFEIEQKAPNHFEIFDRRFNSRHADKFKDIEQAKKKIDQLAAKQMYSVESSDPSSKPPKKWFDSMEKEIKRNNPEYSMEQVDKTIGDIWYHKLSDKKREEIRGREGKHYKAVSKYPMLAKVIKVPSMLSKILAKSDDYRKEPVDDQIWEVEPLKWKKAKQGQSQPLNYPMNPDAKSPSEKMDGLPVEAGRIKGPGPMRGR